MKIGKTKMKNLKIIKGDFKNRQNANIPRMPKGLSPESKRWWWRIMKQIDKSILLPGDRFALVLLCDALSGYEVTKRVLKEKGKTYKIKDSKGRVKRLVRPEVEILKMYSGFVFSVLKEFFLAPGSISDLME